MEMRTERRHAPRYPFSALAEIVDENENARTSSRVSDLSLHGRYVEMKDPFPQGTNVMIEISTETESLETHATVAHVEPKRGMGLIRPLHLKLHAARLLLLCLLSFLTRSIQLLFFGNAFR